MTHINLNAKSIILIIIAIVLIVGVTVIITESIHENVCPAPIGVTQINNVGDVIVITITDKIDGYKQVVLKNGESESVYIPYNQMIKLQQQLSFAENKNKM